MATVARDLYGVLLQGDSMSFRHKPCPATIGQVGVARYLKNAILEARGALSAISVIDLSSLRESLAKELFRVHAISLVSNFRGFSECGVWLITFDFWTGFKVQKPQNKNEVRMKLK